MTGETHVFTVPPGEAGQRLDQFVSARLEAVSRAAAQRLIETGQVLVDGRAVAKSSARVRAGQEIKVTLTPPPPPAITPAPVPLDVVYEDEDMAVINKPRGLVVHPAPGHAGDTLVNALAARWHETAHVGDPARPGIVHRLDKDTTGLLVVAKTTAAMASLQEQIRTRGARRDYLAVVWGHLPASSGSVEAPVGRDPRQRLRMAVVAQRGRAARTRFRVLHEFKEHSLLLLTLDTGRTHQIRVHMAAAGYPVLGDRTYGRRAGPLDEILGGQALHAWRLTLRHPRDGRLLTFHAPPPADFRAAVEALGLPAEGLGAVLSSLAAGLERVD